MTIQLQYSCSKCGLHDVKLDVPARGPEEDIRPWMDETIRLIARDHQIRSYGCQATTLSGLKIPMTGTDRVGGPTVQ